MPGRRLSSPSPIGGPGVLIVLLAGPAVLPSKVILKDLRRYLPAKNSAVLQRMVKVQSRQNARPIYFFEPIGRAVKSMRVDAVAEAVIVVYYNVNLTGSKEVLHKF